MMMDGRTDRPTDGLTDIVTYRSRSMRQKHRMMGIAALERNFNGDFNAAPAYLFLSRSYEPKQLTTKNLIFCACRGWAELKPSSLYST